jgi:hypothetical protein
MAEELSEDRQRLIFRYMQDTARAEPVEPQSRPVLVDRFVEVDAAPARLDLVRWRAAALVHAHPQLRLALVLVVIAVTVGWLVARG